MCALANNKIKRIRKITQLLFAPAIPVLIALWFSSFIGLSDAYLASKMRTPALVALGFCEPLWFLVTLLTTGLCSGISVGLAAKCSAESAPAPDSQFFLVDSLFLSAILGFILLFAALFLSIFLSYHPHWLCGTAKSVADYFRICSLSNLPFVLMQAQCAIFRATGRSRNVVLLWAVAAFIEIALSNLLVSFGFGDLNILSASWVLACFSSACLGFFLMKPLLQNFDYKAYARSSWSAHATSARSVSSIGLPVAFGELG